MADSRYREHISKGLQGALARAEQKVWQLDDTRVIVLSDLHRGQRDSADDFRQCETTYGQALDFYLREGYSLVVLGDSEELWEGWPKWVLDAYEHSVGLEARFHSSGSERYFKVWGNHDDLWQFPEQVTKHLDGLLGPIRVLEGLDLHLLDGDHELGRVFLVHGHQGTRSNDRWSRFSRFFVRWFWRPYQRLTKVRLTTPARDYELREKHDLAMYDWAAAIPGLILLAGHTHNPVFLSKAETDTIERVCRHFDDQPPDRTSTEDSERRRRAREELEWVRSREETAAREPQIVRTRPCYFNSGCCSFSNGDITGIEIADGEIRLVRWSADSADEADRVLDARDLRQVFVELED